MRINHLFINSMDVDQSAQFYCNFLGFVPTKRFNEGLGECQIVHRSEGGYDLDLLISPTGGQKLVHAQHIAFEVDSVTEFESHLRLATDLNLKPRSGVALNSEPGERTLVLNGKTYRHFYVLDPSYVNVEILWRVR